MQIQRSGGCRSTEVILQGNPEHGFKTLNRRWVRDRTVRGSLNRFSNNGLSCWGLHAINLLAGAATQTHAKQQCEH